MLPTLSFLTGSEFLTPQMLFLEVFGATILWNVFGLSSVLSGDAECYGYDTFHSRTRVVTMSALHLRTHSQGL